MNIEPDWSSLLWNNWHASNPFRDLDPVSCNSLLPIPNKGMVIELCLDSSCQLIIAVVLFGLFLLATDCH